MTYGGTKECAGGCGGHLTPVQAMLSDRCPRCRQDKLTALLKNRMT